MATGRTSQCQAVAGKGWKMHRCRNRVPRPEVEVLCAVGTVDTTPDTTTPTTVPSSTASSTRFPPTLCDAHKPFASHYHLERPSTCSICTETIKPYKVRPLQCGHYFHGECLMRWVQRNEVCPMCRAPYPSVKSKEVTDAKMNSRRRHSERQRRNQEMMDSYHEIVMDFSDDSDDDDPPVLNPMFTNPIEWDDTIVLPHDSHLLPEQHHSVTRTPWAWPVAMINGPSALLTPFMTWIPQLSGPR